MRELIDALVWVFLGFGLGALAMVCYMHWQIKRQSWDVFRPLYRRKTDKRPLGVR